MPRNTRSYGQCGHMCQENDLRNFSAEEKVLGVARGITRKNRDIASPVQFFWEVDFPIFTIAKKIRPLQAVTPRRTNDRTKVIGTIFAPLGLMVLESTWLRRAAKG